MLAALLALTLHPSPAAERPVGEPVGPGDTVYDGCFDDNLSGETLTPPPRAPADARAKLIRIRYTFNDRLRREP